MRARGSIAALALATTLWAPAWAADEATRAPRPQKVTLTIPNTQ